MFHIAGRRAAAAPFLPSAQISKTEVGHEEQGEATGQCSGNVLCPCLILQEGWEVHAESWAASGAGTDISMSGEDTVVLPGQLLEPPSFH